MEMCLTWLVSLAGKTDYPKTARVPTLKWMHIKWPLLCFCEPPSTEKQAGVGHVEDQASWLCVLKQAAAQCLLKRIYSEGSKLACRFLFCNCWVEIFVLKQFTEQVSAEITRLQLSRSIITLHFSTFRSCFMMLLSVSNEIQKISDCTAIYTT